MQHPGSGHRWDGEILGDNNSISSCKNKLLRYYPSRAEEYNYFQTHGARLEIWTQFPE